VANKLWLAPKSGQAFKPKLPTMVNCSGQRRTGAFEFEFPHVPELNGPQTHWKLFVRQMGSHSIPHPLRLMPNVCHINSIGRRPGPNCWSHNYQATWTWVWAMEIKL